MCNPVLRGQLDSSYKGLAACCWSVITVMRRSRHAGPHNAGGWRIRVHRAGLGLLWPLQLLRNLLPC